jgi:membrane associated rhomboid family serine protease
MNGVTAVFVLCLVFFIFQLFMGIGFTAFGVFYGADLLSQPWRIFTSMFLHGGLEHFFLNMFALFVFGGALERRVGTPMFLLTYLLSGVVASVGFLIFNGPDVPALGASGAIYGLIGALVVIAPNMRVYLFGGIPMPMVAVGVLYAFIEFVSLGNAGLEDNIAHSAHLLGLAGGFFILQWYKRENEGGVMTPFDSRQAIAASVAIGLVAALVFGYIYQ